uniref:Mediator-associated protein 2 n=1 Tax=Brassica oleracea TaxID=3712 RepID=A0A3P6DLV3_BRAOL|nr:unnamed protein product [Brassica oleracea]
MALDYKPPEEFIVNNLQPLVDFDVTGSTELWLIQCPMSHVPEIEGKELKVKLGEDGVLGRFEDSSGNKKVELVSFASQEGDATVIIPCQNESKIVGKISRRVSLVRFPEPEELLETFKTQQKALRAVTSSSVRNSNPAMSSRRKSGQSSLRHSSREKSFFSGFTETPKSSKRKHSEPSASKHASGSSDQAGKSKKKVKTEK